MAAIASVNLMDGSNPTPVEHQYKPSKINGNLATWIDSSRSNGKSAGFSVLTISNTAPQGTSKVYKVRAKLVVPYSDDGFIDPLQVYSTTAEVTFLLPLRATAQDRSDILALMVSLLDDQQVKTAVGDLESVY